MGWMPSLGRLTCCYCLEYKGLLIILDAGNGLSRLSEDLGQKLLEKHSRILLILSHYHLDHISGLIFLSRFFRNHELIIAGPGKEFYGKNVRNILSHLVSPPYFGVSLTQFPMKIDFLDLKAGENVIDGIRVVTILQQHSDPSLGIKIDDTLCYCTDTACSPSTLSFVKGCQVLMHETWFDAEDYRVLDKTALLYHSCVEGVAKIAFETEVDKLLLIHLNPAYGNHRLLKMEEHARSLFPEAKLAEDGQSLSI
jgi:ribonuclease BN (tRNA processing enzyme)